MGNFDRALSKGECPMCSNPIQRTEVGYACTEPLCSWWIKKQDAPLQIKVKTDEES